MKYLIRIFAVIIVVLITTAFTSNIILSTTIENTISQSEYCEGWEEGYCEGYKDIKGEFSICPIAPLCPMPEMFKDSWKDGYHRAFLAGRKKAMKE
jgi:hypothetical protein